MTTPILKNVRRFRAVEFFSGIGAFAQAVKLLEHNRDCDCVVEVIAAFDQNSEANRTYAHNFGKAPCARNLDSIKWQQIPDANIWWLSPPCTPFSRRGNRLDLADPRSAALVNVLSILAVRLPSIIFVENVCGFAGSNAEEKLLALFDTNGYRWSRTELCPTLLGVPSRRPRLFYAASRTPVIDPPVIEQASIARKFTALADFLDSDPQADLILEHELQERYERGLDIIEDVNDSDASTICFTSGYARSMKVGGSFIRMAGGRIRRFSPEEIIRVLGFPESFRFAEGTSLETGWRLAGNSVDVRCIQLLLQETLRCKSREKVDAQ